MAMSVSLKKDTKKTNVKHNNRKMNEQEWEKNKHINQDRSHENNYLVQESLKALYKKEFGVAQEKYNLKQKRNDRKIKNYYDHIQAGKKTSLQQEMILQVGDKDDFKNNPDNVKIANEVLEEWFHDFEKRNPNLKVYNAVIHNDEASPHMHLNFVPVATGYKRGMEKQVSFDRAITEQDKTLNKVRPFDDWRNKEVLLLEKMLNERGIKRELVGTNDYEDVNEYKVKKDLEREIKELSEVVPAKKIAVPFLRKEIQTEVNVKIFSKPEIIEKETGNYVLTQDQYEQVEKEIHAAVAIKKDYERLRDADLFEVNEKLEAQNDLIYKEWKSEKVKNEGLRKEIGDLYLENDTLKERVGILTDEIKMVYKSAKEFIEERTKGVRDFRSVFKDFVDKVKEKTSEVRKTKHQEPERSEFEKIHRKELRREQNNELNR